MPAAVVPNAEFEKTLDTSDEWIVQRTGIHERRLCKGESLLELALGAAKAAIGSVRGLPENAPPVDAVIATSASFEYHFPPLACQIGTALGLNGPFCMDLSATCSGFVYGLDVAAHYLNAGSAERVLVVSAEKLSSVMDFTDRSTCILFGDGAAAAVVSKGSKPYVSYLACAADPEDCLYARTGETMVMKGSGVYKFAVTAAPEAVKTVLEKASLGFGDIDWFVLHQANIRIIDSIISRLGIDPAKVPITLDKYANPSSVTIPLTLDLMREDGRLKPGQRILTAGFGAGLTYGASIWEV
jgi:3-oxoacyl-[acyl-carrier-protein] synthase-3